MTCCGLRVIDPPSARICAVISAASTAVPWRCSASASGTQRPNSASAMAVSSRSLPIGVLADAPFQKGAVVGQGLHEAAVEDPVAAFEDDGRLRQPGEHPPRRDPRLPGDPRVRTRGSLEELVDQQAALRLGLGDRRGPQVAQPAEAVELARPRRRPWLQQERRAALRADDLAAEGEIAGADVLGDRRVARADVLGRDKEALRRGRAQPAGGPHRQGSRPAARQRPPRAASRPRIRRRSRNVAPLRTVNSAAVRPSDDAGVKRGGETADRRKYRGNVSRLC